MKTALDHKAVDAPHTVFTDAERAIDMAPTVAKYYLSAVVVIRYEYGHSRGVLGDDVKTEYGIKLAADSDTDPRVIHRFDLSNCIELNPEALLFYYHYKADMDDAISGLRTANPGRIMYQGKIRKWEKITQNLWHQKQYLYYDYVNKDHVYTSPWKSVKSLCDVLDGDQYVVIVKNR
jgi:hypothetical protein